MLKILKAYYPGIIIGVSFFIFGLGTTADLLGSTNEQMVFALITGAIAGITILMVSIARSRAINPQLQARLNRHGTGLV